MFLLHYIYQTAEVINSNIYSFVNEEPTIQRMSVYVCVCV